MTEPIRVLFVDNEVVTREWLAQKLRRNYQYEVDCVDNGQDAIAKVKDVLGNYDVVLLDRRLEPGLDGITVMKQLRQAYPRIEAIIFTGFGDVDEGLKAMEAGACYYVFKPLYEKGLALYIKLAAERSRSKFVERERDLLEKVLDVSRATTQSLNPEEIARHICERTANMIPIFDLLHISIYDEPRDELRFLWVFGRHQNNIKLESRCLNDQKLWGLTGYVIKNGAQFHNDLDKAEQLLPIRRINKLQPISHALIGIPLISHNQVVGALCVQSDQPNVFTEDHFRLLQAVANHIAPAVENALLHEQQKQNLRVLSRLYETLTALRKEDSLDRVLNMIVSNLYELLELDTCTIGLFDDRLQKLSFDVERGLGEKVEKSLADLPKAIRDRVFNANEPIVIDDLTQDPELNQSLVRKDLKFFAILPIRSNRELLGIVTLGSRKQVVLTKEQWRLLQVLADQTAISIEKERLHQEESALLQQLYELNQLAADLAEIKDFKDLLHAVAERASSFLHAPGGAVYLLTEDETKVEVAAVTGMPMIAEGTSLDREMGLVGEVLRRQHHIAVPNYREWEQRLTILDDLNLRAVVGVPILSGTSVMGILVVHDVKEGRRFTAAEQGLLVRVGKLAGAEIEKTRILTEISSLAEIPDLKALLHAVAERAARFLRATSGAVYLIADDDEAQVEVAAANERAKAMEGRRLSRYEGLVGVVLKGMQPYAVPSYREWEHRLTSLDELNLHAVVGVPIVSGSNVLGVLVVHDEQEGRKYTTGEQELLARVGRLAGAEIEKAQMLNEISELYKERSATSEVTEALVSVLYYDRLLKTILEKLQQRFGYSTCAILLKDLKTNELYIERAIGYSEEVVRTRRIKIDGSEGGVTAWVARNGEPKIVPDVNKEPLYIRSVDGSNSEIAVPLFYGTKIEGVLNVESTELNAFTERDKRILTQAAASIAIAIKNAQLYEQVTKKTKALRRLNEVGKAIESTLDLELVLDKIAKYGQELLNAEVCAVFHVRRKGFLRLEANAGSPPGASHLGLELEIKDSEHGGLTGYVAKIGKLVNLCGDEIRNHPAIKAYERQDYVPSGHTHAWLGIPLMWRMGETKEVIGLIKVENKKDRNGKFDPRLAFDNQDILILKTLAGYAETAIQNARLFALANALLEVSQVVNSKLVLEDVLEEVFVQLHKLLLFDSASIQLKAGVVVKVVACDGFDDDAKSEVMQLSFPIDPRFPNYEVVTKQQPLFIPDVLQSSYTHFWEQAHVYHTRHVRTWLGIPLLHGNEIIGMLSIESRQPDAYTQEHQDLSVAFASQVVSAIVNARAYKSAQSLNLLWNVQDIEQRFNLETVLKRIVDGAIDRDGVIGADIAIIYSYNPDRGIIDEEPVYAGRLQEPEKIRISPLMQGSVIYRILNLKKCHAADDVRGDDILDRGFVRREGVVSAAGIPLLVGDEPVGVMFVNFLSPHVFTQAELTWLNLFAQQAGIAIQNARQFNRMMSANKTAALLAPLSAWAHDAANETYSLRADAESLTKHISNPARALKIASRLMITAEKIAALSPDMPDDLDVRQEVGLSKILQEVWCQYQPEAEEKKILFVPQLYELPLVRANSWLLRKVFDHLLRNAINAMADGGKLTVSGHVAGTRAYIRVTDDGLGIPGEIQKQLFINRISSPNQTGAGMGLLNTRLYLVVCDGDIRLDHTSNGETTFIFHLPLAEGAKKAEGEALCVRV